MECIDTEVNITNILYLEVFEQIFSYLNHYELTTVRLVCKTFNHASSYEFGRKSRLVFNSINSPELNHFLQTSSFDFPIRHMRILNLNIYKSCECDPFKYTNLAKLDATINDLEIVECLEIDENILLGVCAAFTSLTTFSFINETNDTKFDAAYIIGHLCGRLKSLTLKIQNVTEHLLEVPVITTSSIESLTILHRKHNVLEFEKSKLFAVIAAISKGLKHLSLNFWFECWDEPDEYEDNVVVLLSELEWNLETLELFLEPMNRSSHALTVWIKKIKHRLIELTLNGHFLHLTEFSIFDWVCDNCPQLTKFMFVCEGNESCVSDLCQEIEFGDKRLEKLKKLTHLKAFQAPSILDNAVNNPTSIKSIHQLNSHLRHLEIALDADVNVEDLGLIGHFRDLTNLKISIVYTEEPGDIKIGESIFMNQLFQNFTSLQVLSFELLRGDETEYSYEYEVKDCYHGTDVRNLKQLRSIEVSFGDKYICQWMSFELLAQMPGLQSITFIGYKDEIQLSDITRILQNCTHLTRLHFTDCKWAEENEAIKSQLIAALPYGRKCSIKVDSS